jgi:hypothetical protein
MRFLMIGDYNKNSKKVLSLIIATKVKLKLKYTIKFIRTENKYK